MDHQWPNITSYCNWKLSFMYINWTKMWLWRVFHCIVQCTRGMSGRVVKVIDFWPKALYNWSNTRLQYILSSFKTRILTRVTQWVPLVKQELSTISEQLSTQLVFHLFCGIHVAQSLVFCIMFCRSLFVFLSILFWPLYFLSFNLWLLITPLVSSSWMFLVTFLLAQCITSQFVQMFFPY